MTDSTLVQQHAAAIIETLVQILNSPDGRTRLKAIAALRLGDDGREAPQFGAGRRRSDGPPQRG
jgi:hypothetical protein